MSRAVPVAVAVLAALVPGAAHAFAGGVSGMSGKPPAATCTGCHGPGAAPPSKLTLRGPTMVPAGSGALFTLDVEGLAAGAGFDIAASDGELSPGQVGGAKLQSGDLTHSSSWPHGTTVSIDFAFTAPVAPGKVTIYFTVLSVNGDGEASGDGVRSDKVEIEIGPPPDLAGADLAGIDLTMVDLATTTADAGPKGKTYKDEARWALGCEAGGGPASSTGAGLALISGIGLLVAIGRRARLRRLATAPATPPGNPPRTSSRSRPRSSPPPRS